MRALVRALATAPVERAAITSLDAWWAAHGAASQIAGERLARPIERAVAGGFAADRIGYAFASGYREALVALQPALPEEGVTILAATEEGGVKPSAIRTTLAERDGAFVLDGRKKWATLATRADFLLVACTTGEDAAGRPRMKMVRVPSTRAGVSIVAMPPPPFTPEIPHAELSLDRVAIAADEVLGGDGWDDWLKPFRTVEDVHVHAALLGYAIGVARRVGLPRAIVEEGVALVALTMALAALDPRAPETHLALAGALEAAKRFVERLEAAWIEDTEERSRWTRDRPLLGVASTARAARADAAWRDLAR